ncbi:MAG: hypothetical protein AAF363_07090 [Bacteroidota bacterium]
MKSKEFKTDWIFIILTVLTCIALTTASTGNGDLISQGKQYAVDNNYKMALQCFDLALEADPNDVPAYLERSRVWVLLNDCDKSMDDLFTAIEINSDAVEYYLQSSGLEPSDLRPCFKDFR